jgi:glutathione-specific gamma-glutamylcyclotransferase
MSSNNDPGLRGDLWVFGYGSLMWRPGFAYEDAVPARIIGAQRRLCVYSVVHRGTRRRPGLVLGLEPGGACDGMAYRVAPHAARPVRAYLRAREQVTMVYRETAGILELQTAARERVRALCFLVDTAHPQYAGALPLERQVHLVRRSHGRAGPNIDYVANTVRHLRQARIHDAPLERLVARLGLQRRLGCN